MITLSSQHRLTLLWVTRSSWLGLDRVFWVLERRQKHRGLVRSWTTDISMCSTFCRPFDWKVETHLKKSLPQSPMAYRLLNFSVYAQCISHKSEQKTEGMRYSCSSISLIVACMGKCIHTHTHTHTKQIFWFFYVFLISISNCSRYINVSVSRLCGSVMWHMINMHLGESYPIWTDLTESRYRYANPLMSKSEARSHHFT